MALFRQHEHLQVVGWMKNRKIYSTPKLYLCCAIKLTTVGEALGYYLLVNRE